MKRVKADMHDEYARLCNELSSMNGIYATENTVMYTLTVTIIGFGWQFRSTFLFLLCFAILIPFQILLGGHLNTFIRNGAYLMVFHEVDNDSLSWEAAQDYFQMHVSRDLGRFRFQRMGSSILGMVAVVCAIVTFIRLSALYGLSTKEAGIVLVLTAVAEVVTIFVNLYYVSGSQIEKRGNIYKKLFIEASILRKVQEELKSHPKAEKDQIFDLVFNSVCTKCKQYPPLAGLDVIVSNETQYKWRKMLKIYAYEVLSQHE